jgi:hypothetical protein
LCYAKPGEDWTFFEIDPLVESIALNPRYFTFLRKCPALPKVKIGDARLTLSREPSKRFDLLAVDAFSSDAIPVHLLTREALALYARLLSEHGILFIHVSNQHLDLRPVVGSLARDAGMIALIGEHSPSDLEEARDLDYGADWVALAKRSEDFGALTRDRRWRILTVPAGTKPWTDDYSNIFTVIKW